VVDRQEISPSERRPRGRRARVTSSVVLSVVLFVIQWVCSPGWAAAQGQRPTPSLGVSNPSLEIHPSWENAPWEPKVHTILNVTAQASLVCCLLAIVIGGGAMGVGRILGSYQSGTRGLQFVLGGAGGALVIVSAPALVSWLIS
jgi:hypothetical protein